MIRVLAAATAITVVGGGAVLVASEYLRGTDFRLPPREEWARAAAWLRADLEDDIASLRETSVSDAVETTAATILILSVSLRAGIHIGIHMLGSGGKDPAWTDFGLAVDPVGPRPAWNDWSARLTTASIGVWLWVVLPGIEPDFGPVVSLTATAWLAANAAVLLGDPVLGVVKHLSRSPTQHSRELTTNTKTGEKHG